MFSNFIVAQKWRDERWSSFQTQEYCQLHIVYVVRIFPIFPRRPLNGHWNRVRSRLFPSISYLCLSIHSIYLYLSKMLPNWRRIDKGLKSAFLIPYFSWPGILVQMKSPWTDNSPKTCCLYSFRPFANTSDKFPSSTEVCWYFLKNPVSRLYSIHLYCYTSVD